MGRAEERIVFLAQDGDSTRSIYHALAQEFSDVTVVLERPVPRFQMISRRITKLGFGTVVGQVLFLTAIVPWLRRAGRSRIGAVGRDFGLNLSPIDGQVFRVPSVNSEQTRELLRRLSPRVVVISGTRIIGKDTLRAVDAPFINMHAGITPLYRGVHGAYWALAEGRPELVGTTIHRVDEGIDTGGVIDQVFFTVTRRDTFATYPYLHTAHGMPILIKAVRRAMDGEVGDGGSNTLPSKLRSHPTLWSYIRARRERGVR